jgi:uncharacterized membrane protein
MPDPHILAAILAVGATSYAMRAGGFIAAGLLPQKGLLQRVLKLAPGNLFAAFAAAGMMEGGWPSTIGCLGAILAMVATKREWAALGLGFALAAAAAIVIGQGP